MSMRLSRSIVGEAEAEAVRRVIVEDGYLGMGHETCLFEQELAASLGVAPEQVVTTNTGTAALTLAVDAIAPRDAARKPQIFLQIPLQLLLAPGQLRPKRLQKRCKFRFGIHSRQMRHQLCGGNAGRAVRRPIGQQPMI